MATKEVFISYKAEEIEEASWVKSVLESNGISCWMAPTCIPGGSNYATEIPQAIRAAKVFVLILSSKAQSSQWVSKEVDLAINEGKVVLPFMLENCALRDDFNFYLTNVQRYSAYENKAAAIQKMLNEIKAILGINNTVDEKVGEPVNTNTPPSSASAAVTFASTKAKRESLSILSLVFGIISIVCMFFVFLLIPNVLSIIFSVMSLDRIKKDNSSGKGMAIAGLVLGMISMLFGFAMLLGVIGFVIALVIDVVSLILFVKKCKA